MEALWKFLWIYEANILRKGVFQMFKEPLYKICMVGFFYSAMSTGKKTRSTNLMHSPLDCRLSTIASERKKKGVKVDSGFGNDFGNKFEICELHYPH